jgi:hypothetical protein
MIKPNGAIKEWCPKTFLTKKITNIYFINLAVKTCKTIYQAWILLPINYVFFMYIFLLKVHWYSCLIFTVILMKYIIFSIGIILLWHTAMRKRVKDLGCVHTNIRTWSDNTIDPKAKSDQRTHVQILVMPCGIVSCVDHLRSDSFGKLVVVGNLHRTSVGPEVSQDTQTSLW